MYQGFFTRLAILAYCVASLIIIRIQIGKNNWDLETCRKSLRQELCRGVIFIFSRIGGRIENECGIFCCKHFVFKRSSLDCS